MKRIRNNPLVTVAPCTVSGKSKGPAVEGLARILPKNEEAAASRALTRKYWILRPLNDAFNATLRFLRGGRATPESIEYLEIEAVSEPDPQPPSRETGKGSSASGLPAR